ncbi:hypothetical protein [Inhella sp.]|uniref:hypothetical protein n=1 Tax=Inhella sp. TaxID=1921806 RepID=UPI0035B0E2DD
MLEQWDNDRDHGNQTTDPAKDSLHHYLIPGQQVTGNPNSTACKYSDADEQQQQHCQLSNATHFRQLQSSSLLFAESTAPFTPAVTSPETKPPQPPFNTEPIVR